MIIHNIVESQRQYFLSGKTRTYEFRLAALKKLKTAIRFNERLLMDALRSDLNKGESETYMCEIGIVYDEINYHIKNLKSWMRDKRVPTPLAQFHSRSFISSQPYGLVLIMSPWNYPVQLCLSPLVGAISAGNCAVIKPSAYAPASSSVVSKILRESFESEYISVIEGGREQNAALLEEKFDYIYFTGSVSVVLFVLESASKYLTPVSLELGGKSPVIVDKSANIEIAARRICFGKILNAGQTCIAPDYLFIHKSKKEEFIHAYKKALAEFFPTGDYSDYPRIVNEKHFKRILGLMEGEEIVLGGKYDTDALMIEPTLLNDVQPSAPVMQEEIFGPLLPMMEFDDLGECIDFIRSRPKPLALYLFTDDKASEKRVLDTCSFGGGCINDTIIHIATPHMGFGGVGESGMGSYHGKCSFETFSHKRSIVKKSYFPDLIMRYRPYSILKDKIIRIFMR